MGRDSQKCPPRPRICSPFPSFSFLSYEGFFCRLSPPPPRYVILRRKVATKQRGTRRRRGIKERQRRRGGEGCSSRRRLRQKKHPPPTHNGFPTSSPKITGERKYTGFRSRRRRRYIHYSCSTCLTHKHEQSPPSPPLHRTTQRRKLLSCSGGRAPAFLSPSFPAYFPKKYRVQEPGKLVPMR